MKIIVFVSLATIWGMAAIRSESPAPGDKQAPTWQLQDSRVVAEAALRYVPESRMTVEQIAQTARLVTAQDCRIPYIADSINGKQCWKVVVNVDSLEGWHPVPRSAPRERTFELLLDPATGCFLGASCVLSTDYPGRAELAPADSLTKRVGSTDLIHGFASVAPKVSFIEALDLADGNPYTAKEIYIWHVNYSRYNYKAKEYEPAHPVWWIYLRGTDPPIRPTREGVRPITRSRTVIDSQTGVHICSTNVDG